jgi:hypothetical protein
MQQNPGNFASVRITDDLEIFPFSIKNRLEKKIICLFLLVKDVSIYNNDELKEPFVHQIYFFDQ